MDFGPFHRKSPEITLIFISATAPQVTVYRAITKMILYCRLHNSTKKRGSRRYELYNKFVYDLVQLVPFL